MPTEIARRVTFIASAFALLLVGGCAARAVTDSGAGPIRETPPAEAAPSVGVPSANSVLEQPPETDVLSRILADRRRGDYPEIEVLESGFTITEHVQIRNDVRASYESALGMLRQERYQEGISMLRGVVEAAPDATAPYIDLAIAYERIGDLERAEESLDTAALLSPNNPVIYNELGIVYRKTGRFADARASYEQALAVFGDFHYARRNLAVLCDLYLADLGCALENYRAYLDSVGSDSEVEIWVADIENRLAN
jgi:tetratricopeptide (TPR) repeat protein